MSTRTIARLALAASTLIPAALVAAVTQPAAAHGEDRQERFLYVSTIAQSESDPDFVAVIGADPGQPDFGQIVHRMDMPNVGDELHHFGYSADQRRLIVPGLFSNRIHVFDIGSDGSTLSLSTVNEDLVADSGYAVPHGVMAMHGRLLAPMIGAATDETQPGGIVEIDDSTGEFVDYFGPGPERDPSDAGPTYMYDFAMTPDAELAISTTFGAPALCAPGIDPACLGDEVAVWDVHAEEVVQTMNLGANSGALMVRFILEPGVRRAFINAPGTNAVWLADDDDGDGMFDFEQVLGPDDGLELPVDMLLSYDSASLYVTNWFGNTVQRFDISDPFNPALRATVSVPHPNMLRLSPDNSRLYVSNSLLTPWDNDPDFGDPRNSDYGIWLFDVDTSGDLSPLHPDGSAWVSFTNVEKQTTTGPAGPHMMLFDPSIPLEPGEH
jgi:selenium-binding protein 1